MRSRLLYLSWCSLFVLAHAAAQDPVAASPSSSTTSQRLEYYLHRTYSWQRMSWLAADTAIDHLLGEPEWGRGMRGYGCQYASGFGRRLISNSVEFGAVLALRQETRYRPSRMKGVIPRIRWAATHAFLATGPGGNVQPAYARFTGI